MSDEEFAQLLNKIARREDEAIALRSERINASVRVASHVRELAASIAVRLEAWARLIDESREMMLDMDAKIYR